MTRLANSLSNILGRHVVNKTGITGIFDVGLHCSPDLAGDATDPSLLTALKQQPGLRFTSGKGAV